MIELKIIKTVNIPNKNLLLKVSFADVEEKAPLLIVVFDERKIGSTRNVYITSKSATFNHLSMLNRAAILVSAFEPLDAEDIVYLPSASASSLYILHQTKSSHNVLFLTNECNSLCEMCPQPPQKNEIDYYSIAWKTIELVNSPPKFVSISGGEPTLLGNKLIDLLTFLQNKWEGIECVQLLTNARLLSDPIYTRNLISACKNVVFGIPLHSDILNIHDSITQRKGSFAQTLRGLYNLSLYNVRIEIRIVVQRSNVSRLKDIVLFIGRYLTFVSCISIMQMEPEGFARTYWKDFWIDPKEYGEELVNAVNSAEMMGIPIRLFNYQQCVLPRSIRKYAYQSISDWKNIYLDKCTACPEKGCCAGFFKSQNSEIYYSKSISPCIE